MKYDHLLREFVTHFEKAYVKNPDKHPPFSLLRNTYRSLSFHYYVVNLLFVLILLVIMPILLYLFKTIFILSQYSPLNPFFLFIYKNYPSYDLLVIDFVALSIAFSIELLGLWCFKHFVKFPKLQDLWILGDRITLIRNKIQNSDLDLNDIKEMILDTDNLNETEALAYLKKYSQLMKPSTDGNKNKSLNIISSPLERLIAFDHFVNFVGINYNKEEYYLLLSSILRISNTNLPNVITDLRILKKMIAKSQLKDTEIEKVDYLTTSLKKAAKLFDENSKDSLSIYNSLIQSK